MVIELPLGARYEQPAELEVTACQRVGGDAVYVHIGDHRAHRVTVESARRLRDALTNLLDRL